MSTFYLWVQQFEPGGAATSLQRPAGVEGWLPIARLMNLRYFALTHHVPAVHPAGMFLLIAFLAMSFLFRKAFCSWLCPVGTVSEDLWRLGHKLFRRNFVLPRWLDIPLRGLKYLLLGFFVCAVTSMAADELAAFMRSPYGVIADVKMLNFFRHIGEAGAITLADGRPRPSSGAEPRLPHPRGGVGVCTELLVPTALASPSRIRRNPETCIDCDKCAHARPSALPVDKLITIKSAECTGCLECVAVCPAKDALSLSLAIPVSKPAKLPAWAMAAGIAVLFFGIVGFCQDSGLLGFSSAASDVPAAGAKRG